MPSAKPKITRSHRTDDPLIKSRLMSHGTLHSVDIQESRRFYEEVLGLEVIQQAPLGLLIRCGSDHSYVLAETGKPSNMDFLSHNGIDVASRAEVDQAYETLTRVKDEYGISHLKPPMYQHGAYSFYFQDRDGNWWEIVAGSGNGYRYA